MCGIVAVVRRPTDRRAPEVSEVTEAAARAEAALAQGEHPVEAIESTAEALEVLDARLGGVVGTRFLVAHPDVADELAATTERLARRIDDLDRDIDDGALALTGRSLEAVNAALVRLRDAQWAVAKDRLGSARAVADLAGADAGDAAIAAFTSVQTALSALDRLEVRGRDSAGLHLLVDGHGLDLADPAVAELVAARSADPLFTSGSVRTPLGCLSLVYKAAAEIGELGDNTRALRRAIAADPLLHRALAAPGARVTVLGHTRWASVGIVSEANAHPLNHEEEGEGGDRPYVTVAVNGDVDNHGQLRSRHRLRIPLEVTCDTKVVPALVSRQMASCDDAEEAFRTAVAELEGSLAIAASTAESPHRLLLALRGSGQALYVGLADDAYVVASEPYGVVGETRAYVRMDGEAGFGPSGVRGQVIALDGDGVGLEGLRRWSYDGTPLPLGPDDVHSAEVTTRDIDRGPFPHYLLKELSEAPQSWARTIRGRIEGDAGRLRVVLGDDVLPVAVRKALADGSLVRVVVIGQGTAAVAGQSVAAAIAGACSRSSLRVEAMLATELSGFALDDDMSDTLVVPVSQSGTTTDTNRTVDLVRARGAAVVAIVNRRNSDLVEKADGVLFTSDGRDVEMSVASTKAFYAQVAAGFLLAEGIAEVLGCADHARASAVLDGLRRLPAAMGSVLAQREQIAAAAARHAPPRSAWAVVGNGANRMAAEEVRIKLSELCYKSIACDATEDKKHIDLSSEPLVFVCAAGPVRPQRRRRGQGGGDLPGPQGGPGGGRHRGPGVPSRPGHHGRARGAPGARLRAVGHGRAPVRLRGGPRHRPPGSSSCAKPGRRSPAALSSADDGRPCSSVAPPVLAPVARRVLDGLRSGAYDGALTAAEALEVALLLRYATGISPLEAYELDYGKLGLPSVVVEDLTNALTRAIDELTRPIDAIKHQAKTVTVGISRSEGRAARRRRLVREVLAAGGDRPPRLPVARTLAALEPAISEVVGYTRYRIEDDGDGTPRCAVVDKGGVAAGLRSRAEDDGVLRGTKHRVATQRQVTVAVGASDGRTVVIVPEVKGHQVVGLVLPGRAAARAPCRPAAGGPGPLRRAARGRQGDLAASTTRCWATDRGAGLPPLDEVLAEVPIVEQLTTDPSTSWPSGGGPWRWCGRPRALRRCRLDHRGGGPPDKERPEPSRCRRRRRDRHRDRPGGEHRSSRRRLVPPGGHAPPRRTSLQRSSEWGSGSRPTP